MALAVFSLWVAIFTWPMLLAELRRGGVKDVTCSLHFWHGTGPNASEGGHQAAGVATWALIFYVSKYYELVDTWILVLKNSDGRYQPSLLQKYHHSGVVLMIWLGMLTQANGGIWGITLNASIHVLMYSYYAAATLGFKSPLAKVLTNMQMAQFVIGGMLQSSFLLYGYDECPASTPGMLLLLWLVLGYLVGLLLLFSRMHRKKYAATKVAGQKCKQKDQ
eukprot:CAMPEP_0119339832 /NCGR_PEP_ID=MMETSP1333-20130426/99165_1 /TAXON_ID=418940 /ORGANISM="Scyphosphaera apsteinii, Strain RCC1455" /LENGTH=219 /DNA_ID=CAMNT_0007351445 /DNA_START=267 /DNA_END=926 /DNA_ORIENTATION=-